VTRRQNCCIRARNGTRSADVGVEAVAMRNLIIEESGENSFVIAEFQLSNAEQIDNWKLQI
jgi:hypothetical protein